MGRKKTQRIYRIWYREGKESPIRSAVGSGIRPVPVDEIRIEAATSRPGWYGERTATVSVDADDIDTALGVFRLLAQKYPSVEMKSPYDDEHMALYNLPPKFLTKSFRRVSVCCQPAQLVVGDSVIDAREIADQQAQMIALAQRQHLPRAVRGAGTGALNPRQRARILARDNFRCLRCGATAKTTTLEVDHIVPRAKGGTNDERNLQTLCYECNRGKRDSDPHPHEVARFA